MPEFRDITAIKTTVLADRGVVRIVGSDALSFLDKLVTNDLEGMSAVASAHAPARHAALLSPQGKLLFEFIAVAGSPDVVLLDMAKSQAPDLVKRLTLYKLRTKIEISDVSSHYDVVVGATDGDASIVASYSDPRAGGLPIRAIVASGSHLSEGDAVTFDALRINLRVPEVGRDYVTGEIVAHEALLDHINGVSFTKGCYIGQEIVARMEHRGTARKRFVRVSAGHALPPMGTEVRAGDALAGVMGSSVMGSGVKTSQAAGLALLRLDRLSEFAAKGLPLTADGITLTPNAADVAELMPVAQSQLASSSFAAPE